MPQFPLPFDRSVTARSWQWILFATSMFMGLAGCQSVLLTTRFQPSENWHEKQEVELGAKVYQEVLATEPKSQDAALCQLLDRVGQRLAAASDRPDYQWEFTLLSGPRRDAHCLPGGKLVVYEGLLPVCAHEAGLAVVMSHEIAHILSHHGSQRMSGKIRATEGDPSFARIQVGRDSKRIEMMKSVYGLGTHDSSYVPFSRTQEDEADSIGLLLMARAGYDPQEAPRFWDRFQPGTGPAGLDLLSKHASHDARTAKLREIVPRALSVYQNAPQRYGLGEPLSQTAPAESGVSRDRDQVVEVAPTAPATVRAALTTATPSQTSPPASVETRPDTPSSISAVSIAPAPIVQVGPGETPAQTPVNTTSRVVNSFAWAEFGAPTEQGTHQPAAARSIVTASLEVVAAEDTEAPVEAPVSVPELDLLTVEALAPALPDSEAPDETAAPPVREETGDWQPHHE